MKLTPEVVRQNFDAVDYSRGSRYYAEGRVQEAVRSQGPEGWRIEYLVRGTEMYRVTLSENRDVNGIDYKCTCPQYQRARACKHAVAALLYLCAKDQKSSKAVHSDAAAKQLLNTYLEKSRPAELQPGKARLVPVIQTGSLWDGEYPRFTFQVGFDRLYVVRNVQQFLSYVDQKKTAAYGKQLTLYHGMEQFDQRSQAIIGLLMNQFDQYRSTYESYGSSYGRTYGGNYRSWYDTKNNISLTGDTFDQWFDLLRDEPLESDRKKCPIHLEEADPQVCVRLEKGENCAYLQVNGDEDIHFFGSWRQLYALDGDRLLRCSGEFRERVYPLLSSGEEQMRLALKDLPDFCSCVLPEIQDLVELEDKEDLLTEYLPDECIPCFYFDMEGDTLRLRFTFRYGDKEVTEKTPPGVKRDKRTEQAATHLAEQYFEKDRNQYYLEGDAAYGLLIDGLEPFHKAGEVFISERLRGKQVQAAGASVGLSVSEGLLTMALDTGEFPPEELEALYQSLLHRQRYHRLKDGRYLVLDGSPYEKLAELSHMLQLRPKELEKGSVTMPAYRGLYLDSLLADSEGLEVSRDRQFRAMVRSFKAVSESDYTLTDRLGKDLRPYQRVGFQWLKTLESSGFGGILADEMGLGKTVELIAFLTTVPRAKVGKGSLVVCPASLIINWSEELERFAPELKVSLIMGAAQERRARMEAGAEADVWVTSYELLRQDIAQYAGIEFYCCALDEGQHIKNQSTLASKAVKQINCRQRFVLTGTPIENRLSELWNLFDFLMPGYLYSHAAFVERLEKPMIKSKNPEAAQQLNRLVQPFLLRRLKKDVLKELPPKVEYTRRILLSEEERKTYLATALAAKNELGSSGKLQILAALTRLRQICCDPGLCYENYEGGTSKLDACMELCTGMVENGHQILLFSQFTTMLDRIRRRLDELNISSFTLQGSTTKEKRAQLVKSFNSGGASVFLISLKAGGTGLNLTAADVVIHYDPWWNLAAQDQATSRAHRMGQREHVQVYRLIAKDTIEEKILELQEKKASLLDSVAGDPEAGILNMSREDLLALLDE